MKKIRTKLSNRTKQIPEASESTPQSEINTSRYNIVAISTHAKCAPVNGHSYYIVLGKDSKKSLVTLLHPFSLTKFSLSYNEFREGQTECDWNPSPEKLVAFLGKKIQSEKDLKRMVTNDVCDVLKHFEQLCSDDNA